MQNQEKVDILETQLKEILHETILETLDDIIIKRMEVTIPDIIDSIQSKSPKKYLTYQEVAHYTGLSKRKIAELKRKNQIPYLQIGGSIRFNRFKIDQWMLNNGHYSTNTITDGKE